VYFSELSNQFEKPLLYSGITVMNKGFLIKLVGFFRMKCKTYHPQIN